MSETERRHGYNYARVLIDSDRILTPQFADAVLFITGAQIEILRNLAMYADRQSTFVDEYHIDYYLSPDSDDWDDIQAIVADLELKLMGGDNVIWGFKSQWAEQEATDTAYVGTNALYSEDVPEGEVWTLDYVGVVNNDSPGYFTITLNIGALVIFLGYGLTQSVGEWEILTPIGLKLKEGDNVCVFVYNCTAGDNLRARFLGTKMDVPV